LNTLEDHNDSVNVDITNEYDVDREILDKIRCIGADNYEGTRIAPMKAERNRHSIFNSLQFLWVK
jgi:hypothetical protein